MWRMPSSALPATHSKTSRKTSSELIKESCDVSRAASGTAVWCLTCRAPSVASTCILQHMICAGPQTDALLLLQVYPRHSGHDSTGTTGKACRLLRMMTSETPSASCVQY